MLPKTFKVFGDRAHENTEFAIYHDEVDNVL